jgi:hypothetical protein
MFPEIPVCSDLSDCTCKVVNFIPGSHTGKISINRHYTIAHRQDRCNTFTAAAGGHGINHYTVEIIMVYFTTGSSGDELVEAFPLAKFGIDNIPLGTGWFGPVELFHKRLYSPSSL